MFNSIVNFVQNLSGDDVTKWRPLLSVYYLTYMCNFRCPYCSDGFGRPYYTLKSPANDGDRSFEVLKAIRRYCENVVITGGEPLLYPHLHRVLNDLPELNFDSVVFTTNGHEIERHLDVIAHSVTDLVFSLDTMDSEKADGWFGIGEGVHEKILSNIDLAANKKKRKYRITISCVISPENLGDLYQVYRFAQERGFSFAACPQLTGVKVRDGLAGDPRYIEFFNFLISEKIRGGLIFGTRRYLEYMRDLKQFSCRPFTMLVVAPEGGVFYPCLELGQETGSILEAANLDTLRREGIKKFGPQPACGNQCQSACALSFSLLLRFPWIAFGEVIYTAGSWIRNPRVILKK